MVDWAAGRLVGKGIVEGNGMGVVAVAAVLGIGGAVDIGIAVTLETDVHSAKAARDVFETDCRSESGD